MEDQEQDNGEQQHGTGLGPPKEPERTEEQLAWIHAAMMEELGVGRKDALPLEDRGYDAHAAIKSTIKPKAPTNAGVARWQNLQFDDVDEADEQLDSIADGQLYRLRRGASSGFSHAPSGRGGHSSNNINRGERGGSGISARGSSGRGARGVFPSGVGRGGQITSGDARHHNMSVSSSTSQTFFNDARRGVNKHIRIEKAIERLKGTLRPATQSSGSMAPPSKPAPSPYSLASPEAFLSAMGFTARSGNVSPAAPTAKLESKATPSGTGHQNTPPILSLTRTNGGNPAQLVSFLATPTANMPHLSPPQPAPTQNVGGTFTTAQAPTVAFANRSTGIASSRWATPQTASSARPSLNPSAVSTSNDSVSSTSTPTLAALTQVPVASTPSASSVRNNSHPLSESNASFPSPDVSVVQSSPPIATTAVNESASNSIATAPSNFEVKTEVDSQTGSAALLSGQIVLIERTVKASRNLAIGRPVKARLVKNVDSTISLEIEENGELLLDELMLGSVSYTASPAAITVIIRPDTINITFRFPHEALAFEKLMPPHLKKGSILTPKLVGAAVVPVVIVPGSRNESLVPADSDVSSTVPATDLAEATHTDSHTSPNEVQTVATDGVLIDFTDDAPKAESSPPEGGSALDDLACMNMSKNPVVVAILGKLNNAAGGSFLTQSLANELSEDAVLSAAETLALEFLKTSNIFNLLPESTSITYMKNTSKEVLKLAKEQFEENIPQQANHVQEINRSHQVNGSEQVNAQQVNSSPGVNHSQQVHDYQQSRKYSVGELVSLREQASTVKEELILKAEQLKIDGKSPQPSRGPSEAELVSRFSGKSCQELCQGVWDLKPAPSKVAPVPPTSQQPQSLPQAEQEVETTAQSQHQKTDPALYGTLLSAISKHSSQTPSVPQMPRGKHCPTPSDVDIRLSQSFSGLNLEGPRQPFANTVPLQASQARQAQAPVQGQPMAKQEVGLTASARPFSPTHTISQPRTDTDRTTSIPQFVNHNPVLTISNKKEDMEMAGVRGLSASKWSTSAPAIGPVSRFPTLQPLQHPPQMRAINGPEVVGRIPIVAHQMVSPLRHQENVLFQSMTTFPPRTEMFNHRTSNASSTASDFKSGVPSNSNPTSPPNLSRQPLSPRKILQARLDQSLAKRNGPSRG